MAALIRSQDTLDLETTVRIWQSRQNERQHGGLAPEPDEKSAVARLTAALDTLFREVVVILSDKGKFPRDIFISLDRSRSCFSLWSDGHGVASGSLDDKFQRSRKLRQVTMKTLSHLSSTLVDRLVPVAHILNPKTKGLCDQVSNILEEVNFSHVADDSSSDSTSEYSTADVHELAEDLKTDVDCLIELDQMIRDPATDPEPETAEAEVSLSSWAPHQVFANKIEHRFPGADSKLFSSLGMINYQRYLRCQTERNRNQVHAEQPEQAVQVTTGSKFHDSGLGSSLNPASSYAETAMSYRDGNRSVRIPPLSEEAKGGEAFPCVACGRSPEVTANIDRRHLYIDLQPYVCLDTSCQRSDSTFSNRANWLQHLALDHGMEPNWEQIKCPLCGDEAGPGKIAITTHLGRHLEEISLSALPVAPDSETNSEASESDIDNNNYQVNQDNEEEPQDLEAVEVESEGEISDQTSNISLHSGVQNYGRGFLPLEPSVDSWKTWEDLIDAANREAAGGATGDRPPMLSDYLASPSVKPTAGNEMLQKQTVELYHEPEVQTHNEKEAAFHRRMGEMKTAQEEAKREIEKARIEAEEAAYQQKAEEEERARLYAQAIAMLEIEEAHRRRREDMKVAQEKAKREIKKGKVEAEKAVREILVAERKAQEERRRKYAEAMVLDRTADVEHGQRLDDWQTRRWRWTCPSCGSEDQDRRKGPVCSNCSYLVGDGDGFETSVPEQRQPLEDEIYVPRELSFLEPSFGIDSHTAALKRKLNPIRLSTPADRPLSGLDTNDPPVLPPIQLGNAKGIHTTIPSLNEDNGLVDGLRDVDRDWSLITDLAEQRRRANRMAQRAYRQKLKRRLEDLERRAGAADGQGSDQSGTSKDGPLNDIPTSPAQRSLGRARDRNRDRDGDQEISYGSNDSDQWQQSDHRSLSTEPQAFQAAPEPRTTSHTRHRTPSPPESNGSASRHTPRTDGRFFSVRDDDDDLEDEPWPFPRPL
ncbi:hypothetical protein B0J15DRAFT_391165 [Fusarium solani]|uniref:BZIP domain-containing protein n=1 Tax=Fusarium solani TaxID=169388 RepID=A0A9P9R748_FUSSL|nr:uncharacterized protein B0J15DRAFT_391165 [Fusarium solani]KAH7268806.1 hypothetical protein B0J15DRAFT_391165 [Fusarium solani]